MEAHVADSAPPPPPPPPCESDETPPPPTGSPDIVAQHSQSGTSGDESYDDEADSHVASVDEEDEHEAKRLVLHGSAGPPSQFFKDQGPDFSGELYRRVSRLQAISNRTLTTWKREWCVLSHNFLVLFASRSDWSVRKCILLSSVKSVDTRDGSRSFKVGYGLQGGCSASAKAAKQLTLCVSTLAGDAAPRAEKGNPRSDPEIISTKDPQPPSDSSSSSSKSARCWVDQIQRRMDLAAKSGSRLVPCLPMAEACRLAQHFQDELEQVSRRNLREATDQLDATRQRALANSIFAAVSTKVRLRLREAFDELAVHARLEALRQLRRSVGARRMVRALALPGANQVRGSFLHWADSVAADTQAACTIFATEKKRAREKAIHHGVMLLAGLVRDAEQALSQQALVQLHRHAEGARRHEAPARRFLTESEKVWNGRGKGPVAALSQRLHVGGRLLQVALRHIKASRRESALRSWSMAAARCQQAEVQKLGRDTAELNMQIEDRCKQVVFESRLQGMVHSIRAAQLRRCLFTFLTLAAAPGARQARSASAGRDGLKAGTCSSGTPLRLAPSPWTSGSPQANGSDKHKLEESSSFSPEPRQRLLESSAPGGVSPDAPR